ncbi:flavodoxin family protein [Desulfovibrio inopinatus]|uniref:flavodoxin family protein n=1 Tax=Desulfovibrio inopinatus TaxID=102109 RepID=UPI00040A2539|nr:flavodoxin family protein [Desulfovibrio inopinatus]
MRCTLFAASPRAGGNSDRALDEFAQGVREAGGDCNALYLRKHRILPCVSCGVCEQTQGGPCPLAEKDDSAPLFDALLSSDFVFFASPIYFYHLPAHFKAFIDRGQRYYEAALANRSEMLALPSRRAAACLVAGRKKGERLFEGAALTLSFFLEPFRIRLEPQMGLRGIDASGDLASNPTDCAFIRETGYRLALQELSGKNGSSTMS